jgi:hypothetical protein
MRFFIPRAWAAFAILVLLVLSARAWANAGGGGVTDVPSRQATPMAGGAPGGP